MIVIETIGYWRDTVFVPKKMGQFTKNLQEAKRFSTIESAKKYLDTFDDESKKDLKIKVYR